MDTVPARDESRVPLRVPIVMLFLAGVILVSGYDYLSEWSALQPALAVVSAIWVSAGAIIAASSLWLLARRQEPLPLRIGALAAIVAGVDLGVGVLRHIVPCPGPTCVVSRLVTAGGLILFGILAATGVVRREFRVS